MSCRIEYYNTVQKLGKELILLQCGLTECNSGHRYGAASYEHYALHYIIKGKCRYTVEGKDYDLSAGEGFLINPHQVNMYTADIDDPCTFIYIIFGGEGSESLIKRAGLSYDNVTFSFPQDSDYIENLYRMHKEARRRVSTGLSVISCFLSSLDKLIESEPKQNKENMQKIYVKRAKTFIKQHYPYHLTIDDVARHVGLERSYLYRLFVSECGMSPRDYLIDLRLSKAAELLENGDMTFTSIALSCGFCDFSHFSYRFLKKYGIAPGEYRKQKQTLNADDTKNAKGNVDYE